VTEKTLTYTDDVDGAEYIIGRSSDDEFWIGSPDDPQLLINFDIAFEVRQFPGGHSDARLIEIAKEAVAEERENW
jgi:hypothetical protein